MKKNKTIIEVPITELRHHPNNPRKDLGDLTELTESVKKNGIMQNLTVAKIEPETGYTVLIGNRRFAAAKAAGLETLPCRIIFDMTDREQMAMMLEENMQRNDLTVVEQAEGFQMMLNLGSTEAEIAEKTGFSKTTVHHRLELAKLDMKALKKKQENEEYQINIKDLYELEKIDNVKARNKILREANSGSSLKNGITNYFREIKEKNRIEQITALLKEKEIALAPKSVNQYSSGYTQVMRIGSYDTIPKRLNLHKVPPEKCCYYINYGNIYVLCKTKDYPVEPKTKEELKLERENKQKSRLKKLEREMKRGWTALVKDIIAGNTVIEDGTYQYDIIKQAINIGFRSDGYISTGGCASVYFDKKYYQITAEEKEQIYGFDLINIALLIMLAGFENKNISNYYRDYISDTAELYKQAVEVLGHYSYGPTEEEQQLLDGTHELYRQEAK